MLQQPLRKIAAVPIIGTNSTVRSFATSEFLC